MDLDDESNLQSVIGGRPFYGLKLELDDQIINGSGTTPNLQGILDAGSGVDTITSDGAVFTTLRQARTALELDNVAATDLDLHVGGVHHRSSRTRPGPHHVGPLVIALARSPDRDTPDGRAFERARRRRDSAAATAA